MPKYTDYAAVTSIADADLFLVTVTPGGTPTTKKIAALDAAGYFAAVAVNSQTGSYTLVLTDQFKAIEVTSASSNNLTVPPNSSVAFPIGTVIEVAQLSTGTTTLVAGAGVTLNSRGGLLNLAGQYATATLRKRATNTWLVAGDLA